MNRHPEDVPTLFKNREDFDRWVKYHEQYWGTMKDIDYPLEYPCLGFVHVDGWDYGPDVEGEYVYIEDARELYVTKFLGE